MDDGVLNVWKALGQKQGTRAIPLTSRVIPIPARLCHKADTTVPLFGWLTEDRLVQQWDKMRTAIGVSDPLFVSYTTRHTFAVRMLEAEVDVFTLKDSMGHAKIETTLRYAHVTGRLKRGAVAKMERRISENGVSKSESLLPEKQPNLESDSGSVFANSLIRKAHDLQPIRGFAFNSPSLYRLSYQGIAV